MYLLAPRNRQNILRPKRPAMLDAILNFVKKRDTKFTIYDAVFGKNYNADMSPSFASIVTSCIVGQ